MLYERSEAESAPTAVTKNGSDVETEALLSPRILGGVALILIYPEGYHRLLESFLPFSIVFLAFHLLFVSIFVSNCRRA